MSPQGGGAGNFASPDLPIASCSSSSPDTPRLVTRLQPVSLQFVTRAAPVVNEGVVADGGDITVRDRGSRGEERRGGVDPKGEEGEGDGGSE